jgi:hypothetical protein
MYSYNQIARGQNFFDLDSSESRVPLGALYLPVQEDVGNAILAATLELDYLVLRDNRHLSELHSVLEQQPNA